MFILNEDIFSRTGVPIKLAPTLHRLFPDDAHLEGESWFGRGSLSESQNFANSPHNISMIFFRYHKLVMYVVDLLSFSQGSLPLTNQIHLAGMKRGTNRYCT